MKTNYVLLFAIIATTTFLPIRTFADHHEEGFEQLFDGKSLDGWEGDPQFWTVKDGVITGTTTEQTPIRHGNTFLIWRKGTLEDFELKLEYKIVGQPKGNSGIQYRSFPLPARESNKWRIGGYQADFETGDRYSGICYGEAFRGILAERGQITELTREGGKFAKKVVGSVGDAAEIGGKIKKNDWNEFHITAKGFTFEHKINGVVTMKLTDNDAEERKASGLLALQLHQGPPMQVQFRNIRIKRLDQKLKAEGDVTEKKVVFVAGKPSHGYGAHEHNAGCLLLAKQLQKALPQIQCEVIQNGWPRNGMEAFKDADAVVFYCDGGGRHVVNPHLQKFDKLMKAGVGLACLHYGVEVPKGEAGEALVDWIGGYFETDFSVNPHWTPRFSHFPDHPVSNGVEPFAINDEWYFHMRFRPKMEGVTPILSAVAPPETMKRGDGLHSGNPHVRKAVAEGQPQHVAWVAERPDGGRGFGFTGGHHHWNWGDHNFRKVVLNAIAWTAKVDVPANGVETDNPSQDELEANQDFPKKAAKKKTNTQLKKKTAAIKSAPKPAQHDPAQAVSNLDVHPQLQAQLFAAEPMLLSPAGIDVDHRGRVWVCEVVNYRDFANRNNPVREQGDRIIILEDTDGDGTADKQTVFYQGRDIDSPHGICVLGDKVIVSANGKVFEFTDKDGDDRPDAKRIMYTGIGGANHDHGIHAFMFAPDGKLYFNFGNEGKQLLDSNGQPVVDLAGNVVNNQRNPYQEGMIFRQDLDGSQFETIGWNFRNNWMVCVDSFGAVWQSDNDDDGNRGVRINYVMEFGNYGYKDEFTGAGWRTERTNALELPMKHWHQNDPGVVPNMLHTGAGSPTGICVYEGQLLPSNLQNQLIHCDAGPSVTRAYVADKNGAGYSAKMINLLEGTRDKWFRPTDVKVAPDGSLLVADWYDPGVGGHRMGDTTRGRLFRVIPKDHNSKYRSPQFQFTTAAECISALKNPCNSVRYLAWQALHKMGVSAEPALRSVWEKAENPRMRARALWLLGKIPGRGLHYVDLASRDENSDLRCQSIRLARQLQEVDVLPVVARLASDTVPAVLRECAIALRHSKSEQAALLWAQLARKHTGDDRWYLEALGIGADQQWDRFMAEWLRSVDGNWDTPGGRDLVWRSRGSQTATWLSEILTDASTPPESLERYFRATDFLAKPERDNLALALAFGKQFGDDHRQRLVMREATKRIPAEEVRKTPKYRKAIDQSLDGMDKQAEFIRIVSRFALESRYPDLLAIAHDQPASQDGLDAMRVLLRSQQQPLIERILGQTDAPKALNIIGALGNTADQRSVPILQRVASSADMDNRLRRAAIRGLTQTKVGAHQVLANVQQQELDSTLLPVASAALHSAKWEDVRKRARDLLPLPPSKESKPLPTLDALAKQRGDAQNGKKVFQGVGTCSKCHIVKDKGKEVGPNLTEIGDKLSRQAMFEAILYPSAGISHNYEAYNLLTVDGNVVTGLLTSKTDDEIVLTSDDGIARRFPTSEVEQVSKQQVSLMPADLQKLMTIEELIDLTEYLTTLKK